MSGLVDHIKTSTFDPALLVPPSKLVADGKELTEKLHDLLHPAWTTDWSTEVLINGSKTPEINALVERIRHYLSPLYASKLVSTEGKPIAMVFQEIGGDQKYDTETSPVVASFDCIDGEEIEGRGRPLSMMSTPSGERRPLERFILRNEQLLYMLATQVFSQFRRLEFWDKEVSELREQVSRWSKMYEEAETKWEAARKEMHDRIRELERGEDDDMELVWVPKDCSFTCSRCARGCRPTNWDFDKYDRVICEGCHESQMSGAEDESESECDSQQSQSTDNNNDD